jgi:hypothetical protein
MGGLKGAFIGFDERDVKREFERAFKELETLNRGVTTAQIRSIGRKALKPMVKAYKEESKIGGPKVFKVYRNGSVYAEIKSGTLSKSMGIITTRVRKGKTFTSLYVGPRVKRMFSDPEKGGWFANFLEYGYLQNGSYRGDGYGFAKRARTKTSAGVASSFKTLMRSFLNKQVKAARQ